VWLQLDELALLVCSAPASVTATAATVATEPASSAASTALLLHVLVLLIHRTDVQFRVRRQQRNHMHTRRFRICVRAVLVLEFLLVCTAAATIAAAAAISVAAAAPKTTSAPVTAVAADASHTAATGAAADWRVFSAHFHVHYYRVGDSYGLCVGHRRAVGG
jgi:sterol desaturase/sphingolipid hydroxylase (fatty acid hydroxylase superfamily)